MHTHSSPPTVALIAGTFQPTSCGVADYTAHLRSALAEQGVSSIVLTTHQAAAASHHPTVQGAVKNWRLASLPPLVRAVHRTPADLLHIQHAAGTYGFERMIFLLPLLLRLTGWRKPIVVTVHEYGWWEWQPPGVPAGLIEWLKTWGQQRGWWDREDGFLLTQSRAIITTNAAAEASILKRLPQLSPLVQRIPIGANIEVADVDRDQARSALRQSCGWSAETMIAAFFGFLHPVKGLETLLPAFREVVAQQPQARLLLVGGVESLALPAEQATRYWNQLHETIATLGLTAAVHLTGYLDAAAASRCLLAADVGVLPFNHGVMLKSGSLLALMAHGLPVIATRSEPADPQLEDDRLLRLIAPRDRQQLAATLNQLLSDASLRHQLGLAGKRFSQTFHWSSIAQAHLKIYQTVQTYDQSDR